VRVMTVERGIDPRPLALVAFGGAGPLHATAIADELGMRRVLAPRASGVLSALGLVVSERRRDLAESVLLAGEAITTERVAEVAQRLAERGRSELNAPGAKARVAYDLRYSGQAFELTIAGSPEPDPRELRRAFDTAHEERYGYADEAADVELVTVRVAVAEPARTLPSGAGTGEAGPRFERRPATFEGEHLDAAVLRGHGYERFEGPAIYELPESTLVIPPGWSGTEDAVDGTIVLERR